MPDLLKTADVYVSAAASDGTSASLLEAMASGVFPVVARIPANVAWIEHGVSGLLFTPHDATDLADCLGRAAADTGLRRQAAELNRARVLRDGDLDVNTRRLERLLAACVEDAD